MQITINTGEMSPKDAAGLIALLGLQFPEALNVLESAGIAVSDQVGRRVGELTAGEAFGEPSPQLAFGKADVPTEAVVGDAGNDAPGSAGDAEAVTASVAPAPPAPSVPAAAAPDRGDLDGDGLPWDARIHSEGKAKTKDGKWRLKRNVDAAEREKVVAELKAAMGAPASPPAPVSAPPVVAEAPASPPPPPAQSAAPPPSPAPEAPAAPPPPPPAETAPAPAAAPAADGVQAFGAVMRKVTEAQTAAKITAAETSSLAAQVGLESVRGLLARPDLIPAFTELFDAYVNA